MPLFPNPDPSAAVRFIDDMNLVPHLGDVTFVPDTETKRAGWEVADGREVPRASVPAWFAKFGDRWGAGDGTTTVNLPNLAQYFAVDGYTMIVRVR